MTVRGKISPRSSEQLWFLVPERPASKDSLLDLFYHIKVTIAVRPETSHWRYLETHWGEQKWRIWVKVSKVSYPITCQKYSFRYLAINVDSRWQRHGSQTPAQRLPVLVICWVIYSYQLAHWEERIYNAGVKYIFFKSQYHWRDDTK